MMSISKQTNEWIKIKTQVLVNWYGDLDDDDGINRETDERFLIKFGFEYEGTE